MVMCNTCHRIVCQSPRCQVFTGKDAVIKTQTIGHDTYQTARNVIKIHSAAQLSARQTGDKLPAEVLVRRCAPRLGPQRLQRMPLAQREKEKHGNNRPVLDPQKSFEPNIAPCHVPNM